MSFFQASKKKEDVKQGGNSGYINKSGCYPISLLAPFASSSKGGSTSVDLYLDHESQKQVLYGNLRITNNDGSPNQIGSKVFNQLIIVAGLDEVSEPIEGELPIGKEGKDVPVAILEDLADLDILVRIQMEYSVYQGNIQEKKVIKAFFRAEDNASAEEIVNDANFGTQYEKETAYFDNVTYKDELDADTIAKWVADGRPKGTAGSAGASSSGNTNTAAKPTFGKKRSFGQKKED